MVSIITAIYNQLPMNRLYYETIKKHTDGDWELIIIDNGSTDGSPEFFEKLGDSRIRVIRNDGNYSYPYCQNKGISHARGEVLAFLNNDILLPPHWDSRVGQVLGKNGYEVLSVSSNDHLPSKSETKRLAHRFKRIKYPLLSLFGSRKWVLKLITRLTYGNWDKFTGNIWEKYGTGLTRGFSGSVVIMSRKGIELFGGWDPSQQGADFDMYLRTSKRWEEKGDVKPMSLVGGVFSHHFRRLTMRESYPPFKDVDKLMPLEEKWDKETREKYLSLME